MLLSIITLFLLTFGCIQLAFLNYTLELKRQELLLIKTNLHNALDKIEIIQENLKRTNHSLTINSDLDSNQLLLGILMVVVVVGTTICLYMYFCNPEILTNQIASSNLNFKNCIINNTTNIIESKLESTTIILNQLEIIEEKLIFLDSNAGKIIAMSSTDYSALASGFTKILTGSS